MNDPGNIPFADFLELLRRRRIPIGITQYKDVATLCEQLGGWPDCDANKMAQALGGLLGRNRQEAASIEQLFTQHYAEAFLFKDRRIPLPVGAGIAAREQALIQEQRHQPRTWPRRLAQAGLLMLAPIFVLTLFRVAHVRRQSPAPVPTQPATAPPATQILSEPKLPDPPVIVKRSLQLLVVLPLPFLLFFWLYFGRRRADVRVWAQRLWRRIRDQLPGPMQPTLNLADLAPPINRVDLEDMAIILGRSRGQPTSLVIDCEETIAKTIARGRLPTFVFTDRSRARPLLILRDVSPDMRLWQRKVDALIQGLARRGVAFSCFCFDTDGGRIWPHPIGPTRSLEQLWRQNTDSSLLIISTGSGLLDIAPGKAELSTAGQKRRLALWVETTRRFHRRVWLHPIVDPSLWRAPLRSELFPMRVLPMVRKGLLAAAYELAQALERRVFIADGELRPMRKVSERDIEQLRQLVSLFPEAPIDLAELLRQRFCPEIPESVLLKIWATSKDPSGERFVWSDDELSRLLSALQTADQHLPPEQRLEEKVRRYLLGILQRSEPVEKESLGHLRWRLACAMQRIYLHDLGEQRAALVALKELARSPIWNEVEVAVRLLGVPEKPAPQGTPSMPIAPPVADEIQHSVLSLVEKAAAGEVAVPYAGVLVQSSFSRPGWLRFPARGELAATAFLAGMLTLVGSWTKVGRLTLQHIPGYQIRYELRNSRAGVLVITARNPSLPNKVSLFRERTIAAGFEQPNPSSAEQLLRKRSIVGTLTLVNGDSEATLAADGGDARYFVATVLPGGNWAYSQAIYISALQIPNPFPKTLPPSPAATAEAPPADERQPSVGGLLPTLSPDVIRRNMLRAESRFKHCIQEGWGSYFTISILVDNSGKVTKADLIGPLNTSATGRCISNEIRKQRLPPFTKGETQQFVWSYHVPAASSTPESDLGPQLAPVKRLTQDMKRQFMLRAESRFRYCTKEAWGSYITIAIGVDNSGQVTKADLIGPLNTTSTGRCISKEILKKRFPPFTDVSNEQFVWAYQLPAAN